MMSIDSLYQKHATIRLLLVPAVAIRQLLGVNKASKQATRDLHQAVILQNFQNLLTEDPILSIAEFEGLFQINPASHVFARILRDGFYEPEIADLVDRFIPRNRDVLDVGANIGLFAVKFAKLIGSGRVLAIEPTDNAFVRLNNNLTRNGVAERVIVFQGVATNHEGSDKITFIDGKEEYTTLGVLTHPSVTGEFRQTKKVPASTLDALVAQHDLNPGFIKIDVEGAEHLVLEGASGILKTHRPIILCEICDPLLRSNNSSAKAVIQTIRDASYDVFDAADPDSIAGDDAYGNVICFPSETGMSKDTLKKTLSEAHAD